MVTVKFIQPDGAENVVEVPEGTTLMTAAVENDVPGILGDCGGACSCATCHCYIDAAFQSRIPPVQEIESSMIEFAIEPRENSRLGCQVVLTEEMSGIEVHVPESQY